MELSTFQNNIINEVNNGSKNVLVNALAGSGKTFTAILAVNKYLKSHENHRVVMMAFNKSIASEIAEKIKDDRVMVKTAHAVGYMAILSYIRGQRIPLVTNEQRDHFKLLNHLSDYSDIVTEESEGKIRFNFVSNVDKVLKLCRVNLIQENEIDAINNLAEEHGVEFIADEVQVIRKFLKVAYQLNVETNVKEVKNKFTKIHPKAIVIDYCDMITFGALNSAYVPKFNLVVADECQDFNKAQKQLMLNCVGRGGKFLAIGDPRQAINGFAGAMCDSFQQIAVVPNTIELPLSVNYRCGQNIIKLAQTIVPQITAHEGAVEGNVEHVTSLKNVADGDYIICRSKAPLTRVAMKFLREGRTAKILGNDMGKNLISLCKQAVGGKNIEKVSTSLLFEKLDAMKLKTQNDILNKGYKGDINEHPTLIELNDKIECLDNIAANAVTIGEVFGLIKDLFTEEKLANAVTLMTAHKSKGLENDNVFIILPHKLPLTWRNQRQWQYAQEVNLQYVAYTRAKKNLYIVEGDYEELSKMDVE